MNLIFEDGHKESFFMKEQKEIREFKGTFKLNSGSYDFYLTDYAFEDLFKICKMAGILTSDNLLGLLFDME